jgi:orotate phosphoribosyltransferase-like protein
MGRPSSYSPDMLPKILELMEEGASLVEVAAELNISRSTLNDWKDEESERFNKDFSDTIKRGVELSNAWWEREGRKALRDKEFNSTLWYMNMKNRFDWADNVKNKNDNTNRFAVVSETPEDGDEWLENNKPK